MLSNCFATICVEFVKTRRQNKTDLHQIGTKNNYRFTRQHKLVNLGFVA